MLTSSSFGSFVSWCTYPILKQEMKLFVVGIKYFKKLNLAVFFVQDLLKESIDSICFQ